MRLQTPSWLVPVLALLLSAAGAVGQGTFQNLNFEDAVIVQDPTSIYYPWGVYASAAIPGWTTYVGGNPQSDILYNDIALGATSISIHRSDSVLGSLAGAYSIQLYGGITASSASITQSGLVPADASSLFFKAKYSGPPGGTLLVSVGGQNIPFSAVASQPNYTLFAGDVSAFAGQSWELSFSAPQGINNYWMIDDIVLSSQQIPEPSVFGLSALGALLMGWRVLRERRR